MWARTQLLMDHHEDRRANAHNWEILQANVVDFLLKTCGFDEFSESEVQRAIGIIKTNNVHVQHDYMRAGETSGRVVYPTFSLLSHSCVCNAKYR